MWAVSYELKWTGVPYHLFWLSMVEYVFVIATLTVPLVVSYYFTSLISKSRVRQRERDRDSIHSAHSLHDELKIVLEDRLLYKSLEDYATASWCVENLVFHTKVAAYRKLPPQNMLLEAQDIFSKFLAVGQCFPLSRSLVFVLMHHLSSVIFLLFSSSFFVLGSLHRLVLSSECGHDSAGKDF